MTDPDKPKPDYPCPECGCEGWRWNEYSIWGGWECARRGCVMVWAE